ncbi:hypothetical protein Tdes44962_MAKER02773 [Teratosphaeria destructans]|uniref:DUF21-domain-containing protein n=1 Tax=Teratosphaeria destructans TaxID=418781 RepID=A0A9W7SS82_9PEZI|nr:hypothetical protein Tdes44962_MAKER02773 [Teratosphaeria destructans]
MSTTRRAPSTSPARQRQVGLAVSNNGRRAGFTVTATTISVAKLLLLPLVSAAPLRTWGGARVWEHNHSDDELPKSPEDGSLWVYLGIAVALVLLGGAFAGLTIAFMGQDETYLHVTASAGDTPRERKNAKAVLNLLKKGKHWVLVTLLLSNVITNETLPIVLDRSLGGGWPAVVSSTVLIVIFGEIAPQSVCVRYGLSIGAYMAPFVVGLMWIMAPVAWPTAKLLDYILGQDHGVTYKKAGLKSLVQLHQTLGTTPGERLMEDEVNIIKSVLDLKEKAVVDVMTPMDDVFILSADTVLDENMMNTILNQGYSRIPVYKPDNNRDFIGMLLVKILITYDPEDAQRVRDFPLATLPETAPETSCLDIINFFQEGKSHMVLVSDSPGSDHGAQGVVTLEDVIEELIGEEIVDESDVFIDVHKAIRRMNAAETKKYKMSKAGQLVEDLGTMSESEADKANGESAPLLGRENRKGSAPNAATKIPSTTFTMRRKSSNASDTVNDPNQPIKMRGNPAVMKKHLAHLGPSNAANRPKPTKYTSVKIKPAVSTIPENRPTDQKENQSHARSRSHDESNERSSLLGGQPSDGVQALRQTYGTDEYEGGRPRGMSEPQRPMSAAEASQMAEEYTKTPPAPQPRAETSKEYLKVPGSPSTADDDESGDTVGDMNRTATRERSKARRQARSGSITETTIDVGGVKKTVLETNSSSDTESADHTMSRTSSHGNAPDSDAEARGQQNGNAGHQSKTQKKKRKHKKKKGAHSGDE